MTGRTAPVMQLEQEGTASNTYAERIFFRLRRLTHAADLAGISGVVVGAG
jgi:hypothetical protein